MLDANTDLVFNVIESDTDLVFNVIETDGDGNAAPNLVAVPLSLELADFIDQMPINQPVPVPEWLNLLWLLNRDDGYPEVDMKDQGSRILLADDFDQAEMVPTISDRCAMIKVVTEGQNIAPRNMPVYFHWLVNRHGVGQVKTTFHLTTDEIRFVLRNPIVVIEDGLFQFILHAEDCTVIDRD